MSANLPKTDLEFNQKQDTIVTMTTTYLVPWEINASWFNGTLLPAQESWESCWAAYVDEATRTPNDTFLKTEARKTYEPILRQLVAQLLASPLVSDGQLNLMGLHRRPHESTPVPVPQTHPVAEIDSSEPSQLTIHFKNAGSESKAKPFGVHGAEIVWDFGAEPPVDPSDLTHSTFDTNSPMTLAFNGADRGRTVYFAVRWENTRGEKGPWSMTYSAIIP